MSNNSRIPVSDLSTLNGEILALAIEVEIDLAFEQLLAGPVVLSEDELDLLCERIDNLDHCN